MGISEQELAEIYDATLGYLNPREYGPADDVMKLVAEIRRLREALTKIANIEMNDHFNREEIRIAREALKGDS